VLAIKRRKIMPITIITVDEDEIIFEETFETLAFKDYELLVASNVKSAVEVAKFTTDVRCINRKFN